MYDLVGNQIYSLFSLNDFIFQQSVIMLLISIQKHVLQFQTNHLYESYKRF